MRLKYGILLALPLFVVSCLTYYQRHSQFNEKFESGQLEDARSLLQKDKKAPHKNTELLYYLKNGHVNFLINDYDKSNDFFEKAFLYTEDYRSNYFTKGLSLFVNPKVEPYKGEIHELLFINYYKALNFLKMGSYNKALVECKRMNNKLHYFSDKFTNQNKYKKDAFIHLMMGLIYDANHEYNDAFIAYRNAWRIYKNKYQKIFGFGAPQQLKKDILRTAYLTGLTSELRDFEKAFNMKYEPDKNKGGGDLVFIWHNGMGPVKEQWNINFFLVRGEGGQLIFKNEKYGFHFPFYVSDEEYKSRGLDDIEFVRVAFPKYRERPKVFSEGELLINGKNFKLEKSEDINQIAKKVLRDRMLKELGEGLLRLALKKTSEYQLRKENETAGALLGIFNAITEQADTRNWQTLPYEIRYTRVDLASGMHHVQMKASGKIERHYDFNFDIKKNQTQFGTFRSLNRP